MRTESKAATVARLEDELKEAQRRNDELRRERDERDALVARMRDHVEACSAQTEAWIEAFEMEQGDDRLWKWKVSFVEGDTWFARYSELLKRWNAAVADFNATLRPRPVGRPLLASEAQIEAVLGLRKRGTSLRAIADETSLGLSTVRSIIDDAGKATRAWRKRYERIAPDRLAESAWRSRSRTRAALPRRINESLKAGRDLVKQAKGLAG